MTPLDLRLEYKATTGFAPTYGRTSYPQGGSCNYKGGLTHQYAEWLETQFMIGTKLRDVFKGNTGIDATYRDGRRIVYYTKAYKDFLEEEFLRIYNKIFNESY